MGTADEKAKKAFADFLEKVKRTVFIEDLSPVVTAAVVKTAIGQFGNVQNVFFIPNFLEHEDIPQCALVEMENEKQASSVVNEITNFPFMVSGMPRPVRAQPAREEMFFDRPRNPDRKIEARWVDPPDPQFEVGQRLKQLVKKHARDSAALLKHQREEEEKLAKQQEEALKQNYKKFEIIENVVQDGSLQRLASRYNMSININDDPV
uniref:Paraspeckle component 1 n=1 Tax=Anthurium amnicola TaxID=1678845 RepID=A0A1D1YJ26_9ARAE